MRGVGKDQRTTALMLGQAFIDALDGKSTVIATRRGAVRISPALLRPPEPVHIAEDEMVDFDFFTNRDEQLKAIWDQIKPVDHRPAGVRGTCRHCGCRDARAMPRGMQLDRSISYRLFESEVRCKRSRGEPMTHEDWLKAEIAAIKAGGTIRQHCTMGTPDRIAMGFCLGSIPADRAHRCLDTCSAECAAAKKRLRRWEASKGKCRSCGHGLSRKERKAQFPESGNVRAMDIVTVDVVASPLFPPYRPSFAVLVNKSAAEVIAFAEAHPKAFIFPFVTLPVEDSPDYSDLSPKAQAGYERRLLLTRILEPYWIGNASDPAEVMRQLVMAAIPAHEATEIDAPGTTLLFHGGTNGVSNDA